MSFSSEIKEDLSKNLSGNKEIIKYEILGYLISGNTKKVNNKYIYVTENEFNIEKLYKMLFKLEINYDPEIEGKNFEAIIEQNDVDKVLELKEFQKEENAKALVRGAFLGSGTVNHPEKKYHLEIQFENSKNAEKIQSVLSEFNIRLKLLEKSKRYILYLKEGEEISKFLAFIGASSAVLKFEDARVLREIKNNVNRKVNCETANLNKTIDAAMKIIDDIKLVKKRKKFDELDEQTKELCNLRIEHPEMSLKDLGELLSFKIGKSGIKYRLDKIHKLAEEIKE